MFHNCEYCNNNKLLMKFSKRFLVYAVSALCQFAYPPNPPPKFSLFTSHPLALSSATFHSKTELCDLSYHRHTYGGLAMTRWTANRHRAEGQTPGRADIWIEISAPCDLWRP